MRIDRIPRPGGDPAMPVATDADITRITSIVSRAGAGLDYHDSWMVAICMADAALVAWVRKEIRDETTFNKFVESVKRDPSVIDTIAGASALRTRLAELKAQKVGLISRIIAKEREIGGLEAASRAAQAKAEQASKCQETWAIVAAILLIVVAIVVAVIVNLSATFSGASVTTAAAVIAATYAGTGADLARSAFASANERYAKCVAAAALLAPASRAKAIAACQAKWLDEKAMHLA